MNKLLILLRNQLQQIVDNIDAGNSNLTEEELCEAVEALKKFTDKDKPLTKYQACEYTHTSRATFDNLVRDRKIPEGKKLYQGDSNLFWFRKDLDNYNNSKRHGNNQIRFQRGEC